MFNASAVFQYILFPLGSYGLGSMAILTPDTVSIASAKPSSNLFHIIKKLTSNGFSYPSIPGHTIAKFVSNSLFILNVSVVLLTAFFLICSYG